MILLLEIFLIFPLLAQKPTMIEKKEKYDYKNYTYQKGDRYDPGTAGVCSFLIPGLGQAVSGEIGRGILFFTG